jgi:hypothetical protein
MHVPRAQFANAIAAQLRAQTSAVDRISDATVTSARKSGRKRVRIDKLITSIAPVSVGFGSDSERRVQKLLRFAARNRTARGEGKPETLIVQGCTRYCGQPYVPTTTVDRNKPDFPLPVRLSQSRSSDLRP